MEKQEIYKLIEWLAYSEDQSTRYFRTQVFLGWMIGEYIDKPDAKFWQDLLNFKTSLTKP